MIKAVFDAAFIAALLCLYFFFALDHLARQGIYCDVGILGNKALGIYRGLRFDGPDFLRLAGKSFPLTLLNYHGPVEVYLFLPALYLFGNTAFALHIVPVVFGGLILVCFYALLMVLYQSRLMAVSLSLLLATMPTFIAGNRVGFYTGTLLMFFAVSSTLCYALWIKDKKFPWLVAAGLLMGLGIGSRCFFWWFPAALLLSALLFYRNGLVALCALRLRSKLILMTAVLFGSLPLFIYNIRSNWDTLRFFAGHVVVSNDGINNLDYLHNLGERLAEVASVLRGTAYTYGIGNSPVTVYLVAGSAALLLAAAIAAWLRRREHVLPAYLLPLAVSLLVLLQSPLTCSGMSALHILYLLPFMLMIVAAAVLVINRKPLRLLTGSACLCLIAFAVTSHLGLLVRHQAHLRVHGGSGVRWNAADDVLAWLRQNHAERLGLGDTGLWDTFSYLSGFQLPAEEVFYAEYLKVPRSQKEEQLRRRFREEKSGYYLFRPRSASWIPPYHEEFSRIAREEGKRVVLEKVFCTPGPDGEVLFELYRVSSPAGGNAG